MATIETPAKEEEKPLKKKKVELVKTKERKIRVDNESN